jgi:hypothetical protein
MSMAATVSNGSVFAGTAAALHKQIRLPGVGLASGNNRPVAVNDLSLNAPHSHSHAVCFTICSLKTET